MKYTIAGTLAIAAALTACDIPVKKAPPVEQGLGAGAVPAESTPAPVDTMAAMQPNAPAATPAATPVAPAPAPKKIAKTTDPAPVRPAAKQPVVKSDVVRARWDSAQGGWVYSKLGDSTTIRTPGDTKGDSAFNQAKGDSMKVAFPRDSATIREPGVLKGDSAFNQQKGDSVKPIAPPVMPEMKPLQGNDTMPSKQVPSPAPSTLPEPAPVPVPVPAPAPAPPQ